MNRRDLLEVAPAMIPWLVYHGVNLLWLDRVELTDFGYLIVSYRDQPYDVAVTIELEPPL